MYVCTYICFTAKPTLRGRGAPPDRAEFSVVRHRAGPERADYRTSTVLKS